MCFEIGVLVGFWEFLNHEGLAQIQDGRIDIAKSLLPLGPAGVFAAWFGIQFNIHLTIVL